jgi:Protein of unknown function (DUF3987)/Bifunctional DNA primase/polymerase, N-terminal
MSAPNTPLAAARECLRRGWQPIPLDGKRPVHKSWPNSRYSAAELESIFARPNVNIGLILGAPSAGLVDVDLDCPEAVALASIFLTSTRAKFGRKSKARSHWLYIVKDTVNLKTTRFADPEQVNKTADTQGALLELRGAGGQTMVPPSIHPSGEAVEWDGNIGDPATIEYAALRVEVSKLAAAALIARRWNRGLPRHDATLALAGALTQAGWPSEDVTQFVLAAGEDDECRDRRRAVEDTIRKFVAGEPVAGASKCKELFGEKTWSKVSEWLGLLAHSESDWGTPDPSLLEGFSCAAPRFPLEVLGDKWAGWVKEVSDAKSAPADYVVASLLAAAGSILQNVRGASAFNGAFEQRPVIWVARVGGPTAGKSPAADPIREVMRELSAGIAEKYPETKRRWEQHCALAKAEREKHKRDLKKSLDEGAAPPEYPLSAQEPDPPVKPRLTVGDATIEFLAYLLSQLSRGVLLVSEELAQWLGSFGRYSKSGPGSDVSFWLHAFDSRPFDSDRLHRRETTYSIANLSISIDGSIQPDVLAELLAQPDNGLVARFLFFNPDLPPLDRPRPMNSDGFALATLGRLVNYVQRPNEPDYPFIALPLTPEANDCFQAWRALSMDLMESKSGMVASWMGKQSAFVLRLAVVLLYLRWAADGAPEEPVAIGAGTIKDAVRLVDNYFTPMAYRVFGDSAQPEEQRDATAIARKIVNREIGTERSGRYVINRRADVQRRKINQIRTAAGATRAINELVDGDWLRLMPVENGGRPRGDYEVNPQALKLVAPPIRRPKSEE